MADDNLRRWFRRRASRNRLPVPGPLNLGSVRLAPGRPLGGSRLHQPDPGPPLLWMTDELVDGAGVVWRALREHRAQTGLVPVLLDALTDDSGGRRPWDSGELDPSDTGRIDDADPADVLRAGWEGASFFGSEGNEDVDDHEGPEWPRELVDPWGSQFPGLGLAEPNRLPEPAVQAALEGSAPAWIGLIPVSRPADVVTALGWLGAVNSGPVLGAGLRLSAVLRSWEDRFSAQLFRLGFDTMELLVERPPSTEASALAVAAEHLAFAGHESFQAYGPPAPVIQTLSGLAGHLKSAPLWKFWWD